MPSRRDRLFQELGLLVDQEQPNPYAVMGIDPAFARDLLKEDPTNGALLFVTEGLYRVLTRRYYPDVEGTGDRERYEAIKDASDRIAAAPRDALLRWAKPDALAESSSRLAKQQARLTDIAQRAATLVQANMELGQHPQHFSQLEWSQGILLRSGDNTLLLREGQPAGVQVLRGEVSAVEQANRTLSLESQAFDFRAFLGRHRLFGLEPDSRVVVYLDETGRASLLGADLSFMMDITDPVADYRAARRGGERGSADAWSRSPDPVLLTTYVPGPEHMADTEGEIINFPRRITRPRGGRNLTWSLPMEVAGTVGDEDFYRKLRYDRAAGAAALSGAAKSRQMNYFGMAAVPTARLIEQEMGYSPLIAPDNTLLLFDQGSHMPVVTDATVIGMIGNGAQY